MAMFSLVSALGTRVNAYSKWIMASVLSMDLRQLAVSKPTECQNVTDAIANSIYHVTPALKFCVRSTGVRARL